MYEPQQMHDMGASIIQDFMNYSWGWGGKNELVGSVFINILLDDLLLWRMGLFLVWQDIKRPRRMEPPWVAQYGLSVKRALETQLMNVLLYWNWSARAQDGIASKYRKEFGANKTMIASCFSSSEDIGRVLVSIMPRWEMNFDRNNAINSCSRHNEEMAGGGRERIMRTYWLRAWNSNSGITLIRTTIRQKILHSLIGMHQNK